MTVNSLSKMASETKESGNSGAVSLNNRNFATFQSSPIDQNRRRKAGLDNLQAIRRFVS